MSAVQTLHPSSLFPLLFFDRPNCAPLGGVDFWGLYAPSTPAGAAQAMPVPQQQMRTKKRHNISDACAACRRSKVKCDELKPCRRCLRDGRRIACVSWRDAPPQSAEHAEALSGAGDVAKKRRRSKSDTTGFAVTNLVLPPLCVISCVENVQEVPPSEPRNSEALEAISELNGISSPNAVHSRQTKVQQEQLKQDSDLLLSFARECRKIAA